MRAPTRLHKVFFCWFPNQAEKGTRKQKHTLCAESGVLSRLSPRLFLLGKRLQRPYCNFLRDIVSCCCIFQLGASLSFFDQKGIITPVDKNQMGMAETDKHCLLNVGISRHLGRLGAGPRTNRKRVSPA